MSYTPEWVYWGLIIILLLGAALGTKKRLDRKKRMQSQLPPVDDRDDLKR